LVIIGFSWAAVKALNLESAAGAKEDYGEEACS
jgi:hypothetical protein